MCYKNLEFYRLIFGKTQTFEFPISRTPNIQVVLKQVISFGKVFTNKKWYLVFQINGSVYFHNQLK